MDELEFTTKEEYSLFDDAYFQSLCELEPVNDYECSVGTEHMIFE